MSRSENEKITKTLTTQEIFERLDDLPELPEMEDLVGFDYYVDEEIENAK